MKRLCDRYVQHVRSGPSGLFSRGDIQRLDAHVDDGLSGIPLLIEHGARTIVDVGSGGGVPAFPLAIGLPDVTVHLVESQQWKAEFLRTCARALNVESRVTVHAVRAEEVIEQIGRETCDAGTARALASPIVVAEYLSPLVRVGGVLVLWSTAAQAAEPTVAPHTTLGLGEPTCHDAPTDLRDDGVLIAWPKIAPCAARVPRRVGVAARKPLR